MVKEVLYFSNNKSWIIGAIARETISESSKEILTTTYPNSRVAQLNPLNLMQSRFRRKYSDVLFLGASTFFTIIETRKNPVFKNCRVFFTHLIREQAPTSQQVEFLNRLNKIFTMNTSTADILRDIGVKSEIVVVYGAVNCVDFHPAEKRTSGEPYVLITSHAAPRKRPELILQLIKETPSINFVIHGKHWEKFETEHIDNLKVREFTYSDQPTLMREAATFLSLSWVEGGPFPILEALASGTPVVSTMTGFAPDLINVNNGRLLSDPDDFESIRKAINECVSLKEISYKTNLLPLELSWEKLSRHFFD